LFPTPKVAQIYPSFAPAGRAVKHEEITACEA
jgi:hypothetical protein